MQKGSSTIIIISVIVALILFIATASVAGYFVYKYYFAEEEEEEEEESSSAKASADKEEGFVRDKEGFVDCGRSTTSVEDFDDPFFDIDFDRDKAFVCMGKNINNNCSNAKSTIDIDGVDLVYKVIGSSNFNCIARFEVKYPERDLAWAQCPISSLMSFAREQAANTEEFGQVLDKMEQGNGDFGASVFALMAMTLDSGSDTSEQLGCTGSDN
ncbi:hypothetical protein AMJ47_01120 [Parcubacteria bacterium DG_72]|nr:MAG: hypothetical protein AMJ47_01120 [Parcubacteria bacterium DG_72]